MPKDLFEEHGIDLLENPKQTEPPGFLKSLGQGYLHYAKGALRGTGQAIGDLGASAINWPISGIEKLTGSHIPHVPHPQLINPNPSSFGESLGQNLGQLFGGVALPGGAGFKTAQLANRGYQALRGGKQLSLIGKLLAGGAGGALEGAGGYEENRPLGAEIGGLLGGLGHAVPSTIKALQTMRSKSLAKGIQNEFSNLNEHFGNRFTSHLEAGESSGANRFMKPEKSDIKLLKKDKNADLIYHLEKYNAKPTLSNAHAAQSALGQIERKYEMTPKGMVGADIYKEALKTKNRLLQKISEAFEKSEVPHHGEGYAQSRVDFAKEAAPYLNNPTIAGLLGRASKTGEQTVRPGKFAEAFFEDKKPKETFLSAVGKRHPDLIRREKANTIASSKAAKLAAMVAGGYASSYLPHFISRALDLK